MNQSLLVIAALAASALLYFRPIDNHRPNVEQLTYGGINVITSNNHNIIVFGTSRIDRENALLVQADNERRSRDLLTRAGRTRETPSEGVRDEGLALCKILYTENECSDLDYIIQHESGWVVGRENSEGCKGLAQACPASKLGAAAGILEGELRWAYDYAIQRYGSTEEAEKVWQSQRWW